MARTGRAFPRGPIVGQRQALAVPTGGPAATPRRPVVVLAAEFTRATATARLRGHVYQSAPVALAAVAASQQAAGQQSAPLVHDDSALRAPPRYRRGQVLAPLASVRGVASLTLQALVTPPRPAAVTLARVAQVRAHIRGQVVAPRPAALAVAVVAATQPPPQTVFLVKAATHAAQRLRGQVVAPLASVRGVAAVTLQASVTPPRPPVLVSARAIPLRAHVRGQVVAPRPAALATAAAPPTVTPRQTVFVIAQAPAERRAPVTRHVVAPRPAYGVTAPPRQAGGAVTRRPPAVTRRPGRVVTPRRPVTGTTTPARPALPGTGRVAVRTRRRGGVHQGANLAAIYTAPPAAFYTDPYQSNPAPGVTDDPTQGTYLDAPNRGVTSDPTQGGFG